MKTAIAWFIRIVGVVIATTILTLAGLLFAYVTWRSFYEAAAERGVAGALWDGVYGMTVGAGVLLIAFIALGGFVWATDHLDSVAKSNK